MPSKRVGNSKRSKGVSRKDIDTPVSQSTQAGTVMKFGDFGPPASKSFLPCVGFPDRLKCKLKYADQYGFSGATPAAQVFRGNSLFDPDLTGTGHQPRYYDQLTAIYGQYCVTGVKARFEVINTGAKGLFVTACYSDSNISTYTQNQLAEQRYSCTTTIDVPTGESVAVIDLPWISISQLQGQRELESDPNNYSLISTNPVDPTFIILKMAAVDGVTSTTAEVQAEIEFTAIFKELIPPGQS